VLGLPAVLALAAAGVQWAQERSRLRTWHTDARKGFDADDAEASARALLAWCDARQAQTRQGLGRLEDRTTVLRERPGFISPDAFSREPYRYTLGQARPAGAAGAPAQGFTSVHLLLNDGAGHYFRVERRLC